MATVYGPCEGGLDSTSEQGPEATTVADCEGVVVDEPVADGEVVEDDASVGKAVKEAVGVIVGDGEGVGVDAAVIVALAVAVGDAVGVTEEPETVEVGVGEPLRLGVSEDVTDAGTLGVMLGVGLKNATHCSDT